MTNGSSIKLLTGESGGLCDPWHPCLGVGWRSRKAGGRRSTNLYSPWSSITDTLHLFNPGNSHPELAQAVASRLGIPLCQSTVKKFSDNETSVQIGESVREEDVYIIQVRLLFVKFWTTPAPLSFLCSIS